MKIHTEILGNTGTGEWRRKLQDAECEIVELDQWTAQKSRLVGRSDRGNEYAVALSRHRQLLDGDILEYDPQSRRAVVVRIKLNDVMVADLGALTSLQPEEILRTAFELGHAVGNQHWPAVVKGTDVYIPLTVDRKVMESVMHTHHIENVEYRFSRGQEIIPYLAPHEIRRLFGGAEPSGHSHVHAHQL